MTNAHIPTETSKAGAPRLAPWQERKVLRHLGEHICLTIRNQDLARLVGLSTSQFSRRFRGSFGLSPRGYVIRSRLDHAKALMQQTRSPLCQIALASGFSDQSHLSRTFHALMGATPNRWRREQGWRDSRPHAQDLNSVQGMRTL